MTIRSILIIIISFVLGKKKALVIFRDLLNKKRTAFTKVDFLIYQNHNFYFNNRCISIKAITAITIIRTNKLL